MLSFEKEEFYICNKCNETKSLDCFKRIPPPKNAGNLYFKNYRKASPYCCECTKIYMKEYRNRMKEKIKEYHRQRYIKKRKF